MNARAETEAYSYIIDLVYERCRVRLHDGKQQLINARLGKRMRHLGLQSLTQYCEYLRRQSNDEEITHVVDALTTNYTHFLREEDHFRFLVQKALPAMVADRPRRFRVWSAACASGEEPFSMAFYLMEHYPPMAGWDWKVFATDISTKALDKARQAIYSSDRLDTMSADWRRKYFQVGHNQWEGYCRVKPTVTERVVFEQLNLLGSYSLADRFEVIFCRNVMIYFDRPTQSQLVDKLLQVLQPKGYLVIGHSESLTGLSAPLKCLRPSIYQKT